MPRAATFIVLALGIFVSAFPVRAIADTPLQLEVIINGHHSNLVATFSLLDSGRIASTPSELRDVGIESPVFRQDAEIVPLDAIPGLTYRYHPKTQTIEITAQPNALKGHAYDASGRAGPPPLTPPGKGVVVNYSLIGSGSSRTDGSGLSLDGGALTLDTRVFGPNGTFAASGIIRQFSGIEENYLPLDVGWSYANPETLHLWRVGDFISGGLAWTRPLRMGGFQVQRSFSLRPDLITQPLPSYSGSAVVPSTVDVYVGNTKTYSQDVPAGPFEISNIPVVSSDGTARIVVRDSSGHETATTAPFINSTELLRQGFYDYSAEIGFARRDYGIAAFNYSDLPIASFTSRYGLTNRLTLEDHAELAPSLANAGLGIACDVMGFARFSTALSLSVQGHNFGAQGYAAFEASLLGVDLQLSSHRTLGDYADLGSVTAETANPYTSFANSLSQFYSAKPAKAIDQVSIGTPLKFDDSRVGVALIHIDNDDQEFSSDIVSASYSKSLTNTISLFATSFADVGDRDDIGVYVGLTKSLSNGDSISATVDYNRQQLSYGVDYSRPLAQAPGSFGWQTRVLAGDGSQGQAALAYRSSWSQVQGRVSHVGDYTTGTAEIDGAIVASGGSVFYTNRIDDSFAVVDVGAPGIDVMVDNRPVAVSGADGRALVTNLRSYEAAKISIDPTNLPLNAVVSSVSKSVTPVNGVGIDVKVDVRSVTDAALLVFRDVRGAPLPVGSRGHLEGSSEDFVIGYGGQAYVANLSSTNSVLVSSADGECRATFQFKPDGEAQPIIDPVVCR